tara:strand:- start:791 stop:955 length:165 start_codon:yes stop_codon:yes gene_type:complete
MKIKTISEQLTDWWNDYGFSKESTESFLSHIIEGLEDNAVSITIERASDDNDYN